MVFFLRLLLRTKPSNSLKLHPHFSSGRYCLENLAYAIPNMVCLLDLHALMVLQTATDSNMTSLYKPLMHIYACHLYYQVCSLCAILFSKICFAFISWCHGDLHIVTFRPWRQHFGTSQGAQRPPEGAVTGTQWPEDLSLKQKKTALRSTSMDPFLLQTCVSPKWWILYHCIFRFQCCQPQCRRSQTMVWRLLCGEVSFFTPVSPTSLLAQKEIPRSNYRLIHWVWWVGIFVDPDFFCYSLLS